MGGLDFIEPRKDGLPTIGLALIVKDEEKTLPRLLDSIGWVEDPELRAQAAVDCVVICDTGSKDKTKEIATARGCKVIDFEWCYNFAAARQFSYDQLPNGLDFTLWADADDVIQSAEKLRHIAASLPPEVAGTMHVYDYARDQHGNCLCTLWRERLVRTFVS